MIPIGTLATYQIGSDAYPWVIVDSTESGKTIWLVSTQKPFDINDSRQRIDLLNTNRGQAEKATLRKDGRYRFTGRDSGFITLGKSELYLSREF